MIITIFDSNNGKFSNVLRFHWQSLGHEVRYTPLWDPRLVEGADVVFFEWADTSIQRASDPSDKFYEEFKCSFPKGKTRIICRCHDIDMWCHNLRGIQKGFMEDLIFVAKHTARIAHEREEDNADRVHIIPHGIDLDKFTFKERTKTKKIAWVGRYDANKNYYKPFEILLELPRDYELHMCGRRHIALWEEAYFDTLVKRNNLKVVYTADEPDMNAWLEDKEYYLLTSGKEAFSYSTAECMAKGIKPIINHFYAAEEIYPEKYIYDKISDAVKMITSDEYNPQEYRDYIAKNYELKRMLAEYDQIVLK